MSDREAVLTWDQLRHLHKHPRTISLWRSLLGPLLRWLNPGRRRWLLGLGALVIAVKLPVGMVNEGGVQFDIDPAAALVALLMFLYVVCCHRAAQRFASLPEFVRSRPLVCLHSSFWVLLVVLWTTRSVSPALRTVLAGCATVLPFLLWRLSYLLQTAQRGKMTGTNLLDHAIYIWPVWGGTNTPYGKGFDYLKSTEARDEESLARSQLAGLKMFLLALLCSVGQKLIAGFVFGSHNVVHRALGGATLGLPRVDTILGTQPGTHAAWVSWVAIYGDLFLQVLKLGAFGHVIVGYIRLCGFNVFRNTYKPLLAETILEFWNRYYYYFKELLMNLFFFPTFVRYFKSSPRMRLLTAVFAAAFFGNLYYHVIQDPSLARGDWSALEKMLLPRLMYCFLLALGIYVSMLRAKQRSKAQAFRPWPRRALAIFGVWTFFAFIHLWHHGEQPFRARFNFVLGLIGAA
jgi:hypothetical protein